MTILIEIETFSCVYDDINILYYEYHNIIILIIITHL